MKTTRKIIQYRFSGTFCCISNSKETLDKIEKKKHKVNENCASVHVSAKCALIHTESSNILNIKLNKFFF